MSTIRPRTIRLEASSVCQLKCPSCPTASGATRATLGWGFLTLENFRKIVDENRWLSHIELSNYGEILLNPELTEILRYAFRRGVSLSARNGVNLNNVKPELLEGLAKYKLRAMTCSIDGASQETYSQYRVRGDFDQVIRNIQSLNSYKRRYRTAYPRMTWQFVIFGHNEHEIAKARAMAHDLDMDFRLKLSWDPSQSPIRNEDNIRSELGVASREEYRRLHGHDYVADCCTTLWTSPQVNWDGKVLGCPRNFWGVFVDNVYEIGLLRGINSERIRYAREMLLGRQPARVDIPCTTCDIYLDMCRDGRWLKDPVNSGPARRARRLVNALGLPRLRTRWINLSEKTEPDPTRS